MVPVVLKCPMKAILALYLLLYWLKTPYLCDKNDVMLLQYWADNYCASLDFLKQITLKRIFNITIQGQPILEMNTRENKAAK